MFELWHLPLLFLTVFFLPGSNVGWAAGLTMGVGQVLGARVGSRMVITRGTKFIRPIFISAVLALRYSANNNSSIS